MSDRRHFRVFFWQKFVPLFPLPVLAGFLAISPLTEGWSRAAWMLAAALLVLAVATYLASAWIKSDVVLADDGLTLYGTGGRQTWPIEKLLKVRQIGKYRVRMCFDPDVPDKHMHITLDLFDSDGFVEALLAAYEDACGHGIPSLEEHDSAA